MKQKRLLNLRLSLSLLITFVTLSVNGQDLEISGIVSDAQGEPLAGASVILKGSTKGTITNFDGYFLIGSVARDAILSISYIGYLSQEINVAGRTTINVTLKTDVAALTEVVVTGYREETRGDLTGSVGSVDVSEALKTPVVNVGEVLQGRVTGVNVVNTGQPGAAPKINIRGFGTTNNTDPLYIVDGVQISDASILNSINPADIEQMNVLKDGAAAIYGARASNGVVIITTKSGAYNMDKPSLSVDIYSGMSKAVNLPKLLNAQQLGNIIFESMRNDGITPSHPQYGSGSNAVVPSQLIGAPVSTTIQPGGTNWLDEIFRTAQTQSVTVSLAGGNPNGKYYMSANYLNREGTQLETGFKRGVIRSNTEFKIKDRITVGEHLTASFSNTTDFNATNGAMRMNPLIPVRDDEGEFAGTYIPAIGLGNTRSPVAQLSRSGNDYSKLFRVYGDIYLKADLLTGLTFKTTFGGNVEAQQVRSFQSLDPEHGEPITTNTLTENDINSYTWTWTNVLNYKKKFGDHSLNVLLGLEAVEDGSKGKGVTRSGFLFETPEFYLLNNGAGTPNVAFAFDGQTNLFSVFGTANYSYNGKYFATATVRKDESSRFKGDNKSDVFPSVSAGWILSNENFYPENATVSRIKFKASYGELGNQTLPANNPTINISLLSEQLANYPINGNSIATGAILSQVGNPNLKWETSVSQNYGVEVGLFNNALSASVEYFIIETEDLISPDRSLISTTAIDASAPLVNLGSVRNKGFDISLAYNNQTSSGLSYGAQVNLSTYENEVTELISDFQVGAPFIGGTITRTEVGQPISSFYGRIVEGIFSSESEVSQHADQGFVTNAEGVGRFKYRDLDNNGIINDEDRTYIGSPHPDLTFGINLNVAYKGFDVSAFFNGTVGNEIYNAEKIYSDFPTFFGNNRSVRVLDSWTPSNTDAILPALSQTITNSEVNPNSYFVEDGSFLRLKSLQVGYLLPAEITDKFGVDSLRVYLQGTNLFTLTDYNGLDPEVIATNNLTLGADFNNYPQSRILTLGINLKF